MTCALMENSAPRFPLPVDLLSYTPFAITGQSGMIYLTRISEVLCTEKAAVALKDSSVMNVVVNGKLSIRATLVDGTFQGIYLMPLLHELLSMSCDVSTLDQVVTREECYRIGAIMYLSAIRSLFGFHISTSIYIQELKSIISRDYTVWEADYGKLLWILIVAALPSFEQEEHEWIVSNMSRIIMYCGYSMWGELVSLLHEILWIDELFDEGCEILRAEISSKLWRSHNYLFV